MILRALFDACLELNVKSRDDLGVTYLVTGGGGGGGGGEMRERRTNINRDAVDVEFKLCSSLKDYL
jgi:hypothetical protein